MKKFLAIFVLLTVMFMLPVYSADTSSQTLYTEEFVYVDQVQPDNNKYDIASGQIKNTGNSAYNREFYVKMDLTQINIPEGYILDKAIFSAYCGSNYAVRDFMVGLYDIESTDWDGKKLTYNNRPARNSDYFSSQTVPKGDASKLVNQYIEFDITSYLRDKIDSGNSTVAFSLYPSENDGDGTFQTRFGANQPMLQLTFKEPSAVIKNYTAYQDGLPIVALSTGNVTIQTEVINETSESKTLVLIAAEAEEEQCVSVEIGDVVDIPSDGSAILSFTVNVSDSKNTLRFFLAEDMGGWYRPISQQLKIFDSNGWSEE